MRDDDVNKDSLYEEAENDGCTIEDNNGDDYGIHTYCPCILPR